MGDPINTTSLVEQALPDPDFEALLSSVHDIIESTRQLGKAAEHGSATIGAYVMLLRHVAKAALAYPHPRFHRFAHEIDKLSATLSEERELQMPGNRLRKRL